MQRQHSKTENKSLHDSDNRGKITVDLTAESEQEMEDMEDVEMENVEMDDMVMDDVDIDGHAYADLYDQDGGEGAEDGESAPHVASTSQEQLEITLPHAQESVRRKGPVATTTMRDRKNRMLVHKILVLSMLAATRIRNRWCNNMKLRETLQDMVPDVLIKKLQAILPRIEPNRRERVRMFESFMTELIQWWHARFHIHSRMAAAAAWRQPSTETWQQRHIPPNTWVDGWCVESAAERSQRHKREAKQKQVRSKEVAIFPTGPGTSTPTYMRLLPPAERCASPMDLVAAAHARLGSRETKSILFCALCRSLGVPARLVVSLQPCSYSFSSQAKSRLAPAVSDDDTNDDDDDDDDDDDNGMMFIEPIDPKSPPTVWVEVFSKPYQHWLTVDPVRGFLRATGSRHMEPLPSQRQNKLVYVVAFEEDGYARDVTSRYTRTLYTRVARLRPPVRQTDWWATVVQALHRPQKLDRDAIEDMELQDQARREPMPTSIGAFKDHPVYVLERHLHRDQIIHPPDRVGTFQGQPVFLRSHVLQLRTARQWYNVGREIKPNETPLSFAKQRAYTVTGKRLEEQIRAETGEETVEGMYAEFQTQQYVPPPVINGQVPRNAFGNIDLYVPSMLPSGGTHITHPLAARAAKQLGVSYAEATVGFEFRRFRSLPKRQGAVVPTQHAEMVRSAIHQIEASEAEHERVKAQNRAWKNWGKLLTALVVSRRVQEEYKSVLTKSSAPEHAADVPQALTSSQDEKEVRQLRFEPETQPTQKTDVKPANEPIVQLRPAGQIVPLEDMVAAESNTSPNYERDKSKESRRAPSPLASPQSRSAEALSSSPRPTPRSRRVVLRRSAKVESSAPSSPGVRRSARKAVRQRRSYAEGDADDSD